MRILLVEDEVSLGELLKDMLQDQGYAVDLAEGVQEALSLLGSFPYDLLVLDLALPDGDGLEVLRWLRDRSNRVPVLILTARSQLEARVRGLEAGADDYLVKPFHPKELLARVRALWRRACGAAANRIRVGRLELDLESKRAFWEGKPVHLTGREYALLEFLCLHPEGYFSREVLLEKVWPGEASVDPRAVDTYIRYLRRKLAPEAIETIRNLGYRFLG